MRSRWEILSGRECFHTVDLTIFCIGSVSNQLYRVYRGVITNHLKFTVFTTKITKPASNLTN